MVNISSLISRQKQKFRAAKSRYSEQDNLRKAEELKKLREQRLRAEGKSNLAQMKQQELDRIQAARAATPSRLRNFGEGLAKVMNEKKSKGTKKSRESKKGRGRYFGSTPFGEANRGSTGLQFGGQQRADTFGFTFSSPFSSPRAETKKKDRPIIIKINR